MPLWPCGLKFLLVDGKKWLLVVQGEIGLSCVFSIRMVVLVNGSLLEFFHARGLR